MLLYMEYPIGPTPSYGFGLTEPQVQRLRDILRRDGLDLTMEEAWARAIELLSLFRMLLGPIPEDPNAAEFEHRSS